MATVLAALASGIAGCGSSHPSHSTRSVTTPPSPPQAAQFLHGGVRTLAQGALPSGRRFSVSSQHYRFSGHTYLNLSVATRGGGGSGFTPAQSPGPVAFSDFGECSHPSVLLVYGLLRATRDVVTLTAHGASRPLARASIPAGVHAGGVLVYGVAITPAKLIVKSPAGRIVKSVTFRGASRSVCSSGSGTFSTIPLGR
ncbi:MAG: hypothetical protein QOJ25_3403 [Solirubrobacteraceae bacterium]|jgi:hypothetical protein|nr:hypothetical protein [Solirubrobacteraceae bacterium]